MNAFDLSIDGYDSWVSTEVDDCRIIIDADDERRASWLYEK